MNTKDDDAKHTTKTHATGNFKKEGKRICFDFKIFKYITRNAYRHRQTARARSRDGAAGVARGSDSCERQKWC